MTIQVYMYMYLLKELFELNRSNDLSVDSERSCSLLMDWLNILARAFSYSTSLSSKLLISDAVVLADKLSRPSNYQWQKKEYHKYNVQLVGWEKTQYHHKNNNSHENGQKTDSIN